MKIALVFFTTILALLNSGLASADEVVESFTSRARYDSGVLIWNQALGEAHPRNVIAGWDNGGGAQTTVFDVGDGALGSFEHSTYANFDASANDTNKIVHLNTDLHPIFKFTRFELDPGWKIIPVGSHPLVIYSLSQVVINGEIHCEGGNGQGPVAASGGAAGIGNCGGGDGGAGGDQYTGSFALASGQAGVSPTLSLTPGQPGVVNNIAVTTGAGGGGGGAFSDEVGLASGKNGNGGFATGGANGTNFIDHAFTVIAGSAGGGGGSGSNTEGGGGGGAGGGAVIIHSVSDITIGVSGFIFAQGGNGGATPGTGGGGGAGGGGSVEIFSSGNFLMQAAAGTVINAKKGTPGASAVSPPAESDGGVAFTGRTWIAVGTYDPSNTASYLPSEDPAMTVGDGRYEVAAQNLISKSIDSGSTLPSFVSAVATTASSPQVTLDVSGSNDNFAADDSGWINSSLIAQINNKRYFKFKLTINNNSGSVPVTVSDITVNFTRGLINDFTFKSSGCGLVKTSGGVMSLFFLFLLMPLFIFAFLRHRKN